VAFALLCSAGFADQSVSTTVITMSSDLFSKDEVATVTGLAGTAAWLGTLVFSLVMGALVTTIGYNPFFIALCLFDWIAAVILWTVVRRKDEAPQGVPTPAAAG
jgi:ACS family hexuronate transporter-like MFS transporter